MRKYLLKIEIESGDKIKYGEYEVQERDLERILKFCEGTGFKVVGIRTGK